MKHAPCSNPLAFPLADPCQNGWLIEDGIGETRALLIENDEAIAARVEWPGALAPGLVEDAVLIARKSGSKRGTARFANGEEALVDQLPADASEGAPIRLLVTRSKVGEKSRVKLAQARPTQADCCPAPSLAERLDGRIIRRFSAGQWEDVWQDAWSGTADFPGGTLHFSPTPAMTLIDVDGSLPARELALAACQALGQTIPRMALGGSIGIDFPTLQTKADRKAIDAALGQTLSGWDHERTAMNGFGFVQLVARMEAPSLLHQLHHRRTSAAARALLRQAEMVDDPGAILLTAHYGVLSHLGEDWLAELARRTGREVRTKPDPSLALDGGFAQAVPL